ncbi:phage tail protein, P2 protein I family [Andreprevotia lacus DSM 23236]|jgi:phage tail P2-like protein|uniref:Phage tail protein, P2 protein I family n=1 Tax=Andreprevotia lacus DSM 23236 TaxID=1121001 RepID=A0A1W1XKA3_9NEIS|nr:phage tail protein I [Andreprevotia lacus]SMC24237.1 phage tail protein, P2 protein I family [Andreprevotia lacus DSM 23236]
MNSLLPPNATPLQRAIVQACASHAVPIPLRDLWRVDSCPVALLPWLAWARSVDRWDENWPEATKRAVIAASWGVHEHKGTIAAVRRVVAPIAELLAIVEWWQTNPRQQRGTFSLRLGVTANGITEAMHADLDSMIADARPVSRHLSSLQIETTVVSDVPVVAATTLAGEIVTLYPKE